MTPPLNLVGVAEFPLGRSHSALDEPGLTVTRPLGVTCCSRERPTHIALSKQWTAKIKTHTYKLT